MSHNTLLEEIVSSWRWRIRKLGMTIREFCELAGVNYNTFHNMRNPSIRLVDKIEKELQRLESERG